MVAVRRKSLEADAYRSRPLCPGARSQVSSGSQSSCAKETRDLPSRSVWFAAAAVIICSTWLAACIPAIFGTKQKAAGDGPDSSPSHLSKSTHPTDRKPSLAAGNSGAGVRRAGSGSSTHSFEAAAKTTRGSKLWAEQGASVRIDPGKQETGSKEEKRPAGESSSLAKAGSNVLSKAAPRFKRHNHEKYTEKIRNKAKDKVNKERTCTYATLCRDSTTDEWSLWIYRSEAKTYRFVAYSWDEVDEKWEKSFESDKRPLSGLKHHLEFTAVGKDCQILKGRKR